MSRTPLDQADIDTCRTYSLHQGRYLSERGLHTLGSGRLPQHLQRAPHVGQSLSGGAGDDGQCLRRTLGRLGGDGRAALGLTHDDGQGMGNDVVHVAGDALAFVGHGTLGGLSSRLDQALPPVEMRTAHGPRAGHRRNQCKESQQQREPPCGEGTVGRRRSRGAQQRSGHADPQGEQARGPGALRGDGVQEHQVDR
jgi:hypothetical protein